MADKSHAAERMVTRQVQLWGMQQTRETPAPALPAITISREYGCNGWSLAQELGHRLSSEDWEWLVYGQEVLEEIASDMKISKRFLSGFADNQVHELRDYLETTFGVHPETLTLFHRIVHNIRALAKGGGVIIVGRGANFIARDLPGSIHLRIVADREWRVERVARQQEITPEQAAEIVRNSDRARRSYIQESFNRSIDDPLGYTMVLNNQLLDQETIIEMVAGVVG